MAGTDSNHFNTCYCENAAPIKETGVINHLECSWNDETLKCLLCHSNIHIKCLKSPTQSSLINDYLYEFTCAKCAANGEENFVRPKKLPMVYIVSLLLHNLQSAGDGRHGFFHYKHDIYKLFISHRSHLIPNATVKYNCGSVGSACSLYGGTHFESGMQTVGEQGLWKLKKNLPPFLSKTYLPYKSERKLEVQPDMPTEVSGDRQRRSSRKKKQFSDDFVTEFAKQSNKRKKPAANSLLPTIVAPESNFEESAMGFSIDIDVDTVDGQLPLLSGSHTLSTPQVCVKSEAMEVDNSDVLADMNEMINRELPFQFGDVTADSIAVPEFAAGIDIDAAALYYELPLPHLDQVAPPDDTYSIPADFPAQLALNEDQYKSEQISVKEEWTTDSPQSAADQLGTSLTECENYQNTGSKSVAEEKELCKPAIASPSTGEKDEPANQQDFSEPRATSVRKWSLYEEEKLLSILNDRLSSNDSVNITTEMRLIRRMLHVRKVKRARGISLFDISNYLATKQSTISQQTISPILEPSVGISAPMVQSSTCPAVLDRYQTPNLQSYGTHFVTFIQSLQGSGQHLKIMKSPYTARMLKPFIWRDKENKPRKLKILMSIRERCNAEDKPLSSSQQDCIDYKYVAAEHIPVINRMCHEAFWPSIDLSECLQYPDFSCVAMYKKLVIGFAFMVPDVNHNEAYISFIYTHPDWRGAGIASVMLYHLIQTCMGKDVTLHVSMTNPAIGLYLKFGFQVIEVIRNFYDKYHAIDSNQSPHAFYMKLERY